MGGVPRALVELVRYLLELGAIVTHGRRQLALRRRAARKAQRCPTISESVVAARLRVMDAGERDLLEKAAACGEAFWLDAVVMLVRAAAVYSTASGAAIPTGPTLGEVAAAGDRTRAEVEAALAELGAARPRRRAAALVDPRRARVSLRLSAVVGRRLRRHRRRRARSRYHRLVAQWLELRPRAAAKRSRKRSAATSSAPATATAPRCAIAAPADAARARYFNDKAMRLYDAALDCLGQGDLASRIHLWHDLGSVFQLKGDFDSALGAFERMLRLAWVVASRTKAAVAFNKMGRIYRQKGDLPIALEYLERGLELFEQAGDTRGIAGSLDDIGQVLWLLARYDEALDRSAAALETRRRLGDKRSIAASLVNIGNIERHRGLFDEAEACYREALELRTRARRPGGHRRSATTASACSPSSAATSTARSAIWEAALAEAERIGACRCRRCCCRTSARRRASNGQRGEARTRFDAAQALARDLDDKRLLSQTRAPPRPARARERRSPSAALEHCEQALELAEAAGIRVDVGRALLALGEVHAATLFDDTGDGERSAEDFFTRGVELFREIGNEAELASASSASASIASSAADVDAGKQLLTEAEAIFRKLGMRAGDALRRVIGEL